MRVGLISDTHGLLRPEAKAFLRDSDVIVHAGDVGRAAVITELSELAPVVAVRGNNDTGPWADALPERDTLRIEDVLVYVLHDIAELDVDPKQAGIRVVVSGHSHRPSVAERDGVLFVNPGSAGPRRFKLPIAAAQLDIAGSSVHAEWVELPLPARRG